MTQARPYLLLLALFFVSVPGFAEVVTVQNLRLWQAPDHTRLVLDLSGPIEHRLTHDSAARQVVVEMDAARLPAQLAPLDVSGSYLAAVRAVDTPDGTLRITLDLRRPVRPTSFMLKPYGQYGHRLVIDLNDETAMEAVPEPPSQAAPVPQPMLRPRDLVVAIDAGHGGEDPGAIGRRYKTREKDVTLAIARELARLVAAEPGMRPVMIRSGDYFVPLKKRRDLARRQSADLFVSIHADSLPPRSRHVRGSSVYALSERGATTLLARELADDENASDWIGGVSRDELDDDVSRLLGDLTKDATMADSLELGRDMLASLRAVGPLHSAQVAQAGFAVLKSPVPSILVETAFISNPDEERQLRSAEHQRRIARGIFQGIKRATPRLLARRGTGGATVQAAAIPALPAASIVATPVAAATREHVVKPGDTLSAIARLYDVPIEALRFLNEIHGNDLTIGTRLRIPTRGGDGGV